MTERLDLEAVKALLGAASCRPWIPGHHTNPDHPCECRSILCEGYMGAICTVHHSLTGKIEDGDNPPPHEAVANAKLICAAVNLLPALISELEALREALKQVAHPMATFAGPQCCADTFADACELFSDIARAVLPETETEEN